MVVIKNQRIELVVKSASVELLGYRSVTFHRPAGFMFEAGDWIDIESENGELTGGKTYSLSSSPTESDLKISFREGISEMKRTLQDSKPGDKLYITQYGNDYGFQLKKNQSSVLIAGGVGIAPFRSMIKEMFDNHSKNDVQLIYLNQNNNFLFKDEFDSWTKSLPNLSITYLQTKEINRKKREKVIRSLIKNINMNFYIAGPPGMVESHEHLLLDIGVRVRDIKIDSFGGY